MKKMMMTVLAVVLSAGMASAGYIKWDVAGLEYMKYFPGDTGGFVYSTDTGTLPYDQDFVYALVLATDVGTAVSLVTSSLSSIGNNSDEVFLSWLNNSDFWGKTPSSYTADLPKISTDDALNYVVMAFTYLDDEWWYTVSDNMLYTGKTSLSLAGEPPALTLGQNNFNSPWTAIPEPTAMALLALGAAAVGLRRRFRK